MIACVSWLCASLNACTLAGSLRSPALSWTLVALGARLGDLDQHRLFLLGIALHRRDEVGDEVGAALIVGLQVAPGGVDLLLGGRDAVDPAAGEAESGERCKQTETAK